jgi:hypothetical protein
MLAKLNERMILDTVPSASGVECIENRLFMVGDNSPWLFETDLEGVLLAKYRIGKEDDPDIIPKPQKHDFEAMTVMEFGEEKAILLLGSGSNWPKRNTGILFSTGEKKLLQNLNLQPLYQKMLKQTNLNEEELNIEAASTLNGNVYLFNRGKNCLFVLNEKKLAAYFLDSSLIPDFKVWNIELPELDGIKAGFSGATSLEEEGKLLFTASVENTADWVKDGEVLASFVGVIDPLELVQHHEPIALAIQAGNEPLKIKVESITLIGRKDREFDCAMVTDSDGGSSELMRVTVRFD